MNKLLERLEKSSPQMAQKLSQNCECNTEDPREQQAAINGYLRRTLSSLEINTQHEREFLINERPVGLWLKDLERHVFPTLTRHAV